MVDTHADAPEFGYRLLHEEAHHLAGVSMSTRTAWRICRDNRCWSVVRKKSKNAKKPGPPVHDNLVQREVTADDPAEL